LAQDKQNRSYGRLARVDAGGFRDVP